MHALQRVCSESGGSLHDMTGSTLPLPDELSRISMHASDVV